MAKLPIFWAPFLVVLKDLIAATVSGANILPTNLAPELNPLYKSFAVSTLFVALNKFLVAPAILDIPKLFWIVLPSFAIFIAVLTAATPPNVPPLKAVAPANITSSKAILPIIPNVYPEFNNKLFVQANPPLLVELPIAIASSNSAADLRSGPKGSLRFL